MKSLKEIKKLGLDIAILFGPNVFIVESKFIIKSIALRLYRLIVGLLLKLLSMMKFFSIYNHQFFQFC